MRLFVFATLVITAVFAAGGRSAHHGEAAWPGANGLLVYTETQTFEGGVFTNNEAGTQQHRFDPADGDSPSWSPDGMHIIFSRFPEEIYLADPDGSNQTLVATGITPSWAADGERILYSKDADILIADLPLETNLTETDGIVERSPVVSPDGQHIAYVRHPFNGGPFDIWVTEIDGDDPHKITDGTADGFFNDAPDWSPDGTQIVLQRDSELEGTDIWIMDADGNNKHNITNTPDRFDDNPAWSPDGQRIAFLMNRTDTSSNFAQPAGSPPSDVWTMNTSGGDLRNVTRGDGITGYDEPDWQPLPMALTHLWGNTDCDEEVDEADALALLFADAGLDAASPQGSLCPVIDAPIHTEAGDYPWGDWDCSGQADSQDAVRILTYLGDVEPGIADCLAIGTPITVSNPLAGGVLATFDVVGDPLHVWTPRPDTVQQLLDLEAGTGTATFPSGPLLEGAGAGQFNAPYSWHLDPEEVTMTEAAIEACDGTPSYVEENPEQFFQIGYCPWSAELVELVDYR